MLAEVMTVYCFPKTSVLKVHWVFSLLISIREEV